MSGSKKLFLVIAAIFFLSVLYVMYDMSSRTTFPGPKPKMEDIQTGTGTESESKEPDSMRLDSISNP
jgi:hypothetical protein